MTKKYLSIKDTCELFKVSHSTIRRKIKALDSKAVIKRQGKYLIEYSYLIDNYSLKKPALNSNAVDYSSLNKELKELQDTNKMYSFMLSEKDKLLAEKDKQIELLKNQSEILERQITFQNLALDQSQKLSALEKQLDILKLNN